MAARTPTSVLIQIDRRNRLEGELRELAVLKRAASDLHRHVKSELKAFSAALDERAGQFDEARIRTSHSLRSFEVFLALVAAGCRWTISQRY